MRDEGTRGSIGYRRAKETKTKMLSSVHCQVFWSTVLGTRTTRYVNIILIQSYCYLRSLIHQHRCQSSGPSSSPPFLPYRRPLSSLVRFYLPSRPGSDPISLLILAQIPSLGVHLSGFHPPYLTTKQWVSQLSVWLALCYCPPKTYSLPAIPIPCAPSATLASSLVALLGPKIENKMYMFVVKLSVPSLVVIFKRSNYLDQNLDQDNQSPAHSDWWGFGACLTVVILTCQDI